MNSIKFQDSTLILDMCCFSIHLIIYQRNNNIRESKKTIPFNIVLKRIKFKIALKRIPKNNINQGGLVSPKEVKWTFTKWKSYTLKTIKHCWRNLKIIQRNGKIIYVLGLEELISLKYPHNPKQSSDLMQSLSKYMTRKEIFKKRGAMCICIAHSFCYTAETNTL